MSFVIFSSEEGIKRMRKLIPADDVKNKDRKDLHAALKISNHNLTGNLKKNLFCWSYSHSRNIKVHTR